ncbi:hypothetical protein AB205_0180670 [Aquarana catesbeiana]|uniref:Uncharacterized protein n=1 Tax=Aquarana catesbeiana TaxID=8400 RepID=A0A2G9RNY8_AQUCT|nr:hypothetical protein AB205_0180670 [Aquarana catesbeiana]
MYVHELQNFLKRVVFFFFCFVFFFIFGHCCLNNVKVQILHYIIMHSIPMELMYDMFILYPLNTKYILYVLYTPVGHRGVVIAKTEADWLPCTAAPDFALTSFSKSSQVLRPQDIIMPRVVFFLYCLHELVYMNK